MRWPAVLGSIWLWLPLLILAAVLTRVSLLGAPLVDDEFFHLLVGKNWWLDQELAMLDGIYTRGALFTKLVAYSFASFGDVSPAASRIFPSLVTAVATIVLMFWWVRREVGAVAAFAFAFFYLFWPDGIEVAQFARFYALHGLFFTLGIILFYYAVTSDQTPLWWRTILAAGAGGSILVALQLQILTVATLVGVGAWFGVLYVLPWLFRQEKRVVAGLSALAVIGLAVGAALFREKVAALWSVYRTLPPGWD